MSNLDNLQNFIKSIRSPNEDPHDLPEEDKRLSDEEMREANVKHVEEKRAQGKSTLTPRQKEMAEEIDTESAKEIPLMEKDGGGGGGAGGAGGLAGGGTVAVASDPGVFTPTYGGGSKRRLGMAPSKKKKKKKKDKYRTSGVTKLDRFLRGEKVNQITKKSAQSISVQDFATWLVEDAISKKLDPTNRRPGTGGVPSNYIDDPPTGKTNTGPPRNPWGRKGRFGPAKGQQGYTMKFKKMDNIATVLDAGGSVLDLVKALDLDVPIKVD